MNIFVDGGIDYENMKAFKAEYKYIATSMAISYLGGRKGLLEVRDGQGAKTKCFLTTQHVYSPTSSSRKKNARFKGDAHFDQVALEPLKIQGWFGLDPRKAIRTKIIKNKKKKKPLSPLQL